MEQLRIFLSSSPLDGSLATALAQALRESGADVWQGEAQQQSGQLLDATAREIQLRPIFIVLLSKGAFASNWVRQECRWAYKLYQREPGRILLPVRAELFSPKDFSAIRYLESFPRVETNDGQPFAPIETIEQVLRLLLLARGKEHARLPEPHASNSVEQLLTYGKVLAARSAYEQALPYIQCATQATPNSWQAWAYLGWLDNLLGRHAEALDALGYALNLGGREPWLWA